MPTNKKSVHNIMILSGVDTSDNTAALKYINEKYPKLKKVCYIPAEFEDSTDEVKQALKDFKKHVKVKRFELAVLENEKSKTVKDKINESDILFLGGGNTFHFFDQIQKHKLSSTLKKYLSEGKLIVGLSAGGIVLSPSLMMACFPSKDADDCNVDRKDFKALKLLPFEICPHYKASQNMVKDLLAYSSLHAPPLYALRDGEFISVGSEGAYFSSKTDLFFHGEKVSFK